jgi:outer membrane immunogenic protein
MTIRNDLMTAVSLAALASAGVISAAPAADLSGPEEVIELAVESAQDDWSGFYAGFGISGAYGVDSLSLVDVKGNVSKDLDNEDFSLSSIDGFVEGGYDFQTGNLVFGVNGNYDFNYSSDTSAFQKSAKTVYTEQLGSGWGLGVRAGILANDSTLVFGSVGFASRDVELGYEKAAGKDPAVSFNETVSAAGYYVGAGMETLLSDNLSLKAEYRYSQFDGYETGATGKSGKVLSSDGFDLHQVRASLNWRF